ncbi:hypothetical protein [Nocardia sp. NPDC049707]|uniref:hypothetical protein n=1 Tax=Nocardia sp. NPDC049707 TaxID=3154735 RepID=UPI003421EF9F
MVLWHPPARWRIPDPPPDGTIAADAPESADVVLAGYRELADVADEAPALAAGPTPGATGVDRLAAQGGRARQRYRRERICASCCLLSASSM